MSILARFPLADRPEGTKLYDWLLSKFKSHNFCATDVTYGFVSDLQGLVQVKKSRHEVDEDNKLLRKELCHLIIYLVARSDIGCVTDNIVSRVPQLTCIWMSVGRRNACTQSNLTLAASGAFKSSRTPQKIHF